MNAHDIGEISAWLTTQGIKGTDEMDIVNGFCERAGAAGMRLDRGLALIDTLHPVYEGRAFQWDSREPAKTAFEYGPTNEGVSAENWERSAFYYMRENNKNEVRRRLGFGDPVDFFTLDTLLAAGHKDYIAMIHRFAKDSHIGDMDCFYSHWTTMDEGGFRDEDLSALRQLVPVLALAIKSGSLTRISRTIAEVYLGEDAAKQVLEGRISRGKAERISAVLWFSDLQNYTRISDNLPPDEIIPFLNDYADAVISSIHEAGGNVLKLIGDGTLAIFKAEESEDACTRALLAEQLLREKLKGLNEQRQAKRAARSPMFISGSISAMSFTAISAPAIAWISPSSARPSTKSAASLRCAASSIAASSCPRSSSPPPRRRAMPRWSRSAATRCAASSGRRSCSR